MKFSKAFLFTAVVTTAFGSAALADEHTTGQPGKGNQGCTLANESTYKNPGKMLQYLSDRDGNPKATVDLYPGSFDNVGDLIDQKCGSEEPPVEPS